MTDSEKIKLLQDYQLWRMGDEHLTQPNVKDLTEALNYAIKCCLNVKRDAVEYNAMLIAAEFKIQALEESAKNFGIRIQEIREKYRIAQNAISDKDAIIEALLVDVSCMESEIISLNYALDNPE